MSHIVGSIINLGEQAGCGRHQHRKNQTGNHAGGDQLPVRIPNLCLRAACAQHLADDDANGVAHGKEHHAGQVIEGGRDILGGNHIQP